MPTPKLPADQYLLVLVAACSAVNPVGAAELAAATGVIAKNCGLVPVFAMDCGLLVKGHRRATYLPSGKGRHIARAFERSESEGLAAVRNKWKGRWFARAVRERCRYGPVSREGLVARLMTVARAEEGRIKQAHVLLDLMVAVGLVTVEESGELHWYEGASSSDSTPGPPSTDTAREEATQDGVQEELPQGMDPPKTEGTDPGDRSQERRPYQGEGSQPPASEVPRPRGEVPGGEQAAGDANTEQDLLSLLLPPILLADLTRLTSTEVLELHRHLRAVTALTTKLRGHRIT